MNSVSAGAFLAQVFTLGVVSAIAVLSACWVVPFLSGRRAEDVFDRETLGRLTLRGMAGMAVLAVMFGIGGGTLSGLAAKLITMAVILASIWQFALGLGAALRRHGLLTRYSASAIFAWTGFLLTYWIRATG